MLALIVEIHYGRRLKFYPKGHLKLSILEVLEWAPLKRYLGLILVLVAPRGRTAN